MEAKQLQGWWLAACVVALLLAYWAGGFSLVATFIFVVIYLTGATLIGRDQDTEDTEFNGITEVTEVNAEVTAEAEAEDDAEAIADAERSS